MLLLCLAYTCNNFGWWFHLSYLPTYMTERFSLAPTDMLAAIYKGGPLWIGAIGCLSGGLLADWRGLRITAIPQVLELVA